MMTEQQLVLSMLQVSIMTVTYYYLRILRVQLLIVDLTKQQLSGSLIIMILESLMTLVTNGYLLTFHVRTVQNKQL